MVDAAAPVSDAAVRTVIVTGASRGLGLAIASTLASAGYQVIAVARSESAQLQSSMAQHSGPGALHFRACDLSQIDQLSTFVGELRSEFGPIYGLVNNAGIGTPGVLAIMRDDQIQRLMQMNVVSPLVLSKHVVRSMMLERRGRIVNISSIVASTGYSGLAAYSATKAALLGFTRALAREVGQLGITVNAVAPGFIATEMTEELGEQQRNKIMRRSALNRMAEPIDIAQSVRFLMSEDARNITGVTLTVDAGNTV